MTIQTPVRYDTKQNVVRDEIGTVVCKIPKAFDAGFNSVGAKRVQAQGEHVALCINEHERLTARVKEFATHIRNLTFAASQATFALYKQHPSLMTALQKEIDAARTALKEQK